MEQRSWLNKLQFQRLSGGASQCLRGMATADIAALTGLPEEEIECL